MLSLIICTECQRITTFGRMAKDCKCRSDGQSHYRWIRKEYVDYLNGRQ